MLYYIDKTQNAAETFDEKADELQEQINTMINEDCERGVKEALDAEARAWKSYDSRKVQLESSRDSAEKSYTTQNTACEAAKLALQVAAEAFNGYEFKVPEKRTQESEKLLTLSDESNKDETAKLIEVLSTTSINDFTTDQSKLSSALKRAQSAFDSAEKSCAQNRKTYFTANLNFQAFNGTLGDFESA